jgi:hypothetical protein
MQLTLINLFLLGIEFVPDFNSLIKELGEYLEFPFSSYLLN